MVRGRGFSLIELVIATGLTTAVLAGVFAMLHPAVEASSTSSRRSSASGRPVWCPAWPGSS